MWDVCGLLQWAGRCTIGVRACVFHPVASPSDHARDLLAVFTATTNDTRSGCQFAALVLSVHGRHCESLFKGIDAYSSHSDV